MTETPPTPIDILLCGDRNYFQHMGVAVCSLLANNRRHKFRITIVTDPGIPDQIAKMREMAAQFGNAEMRFPVFDISVLEKYPVRHHFTAFTFVRLIAPMFYDDTVDRVLYFDGDLIVCADIAPLWNTDMADNPIAGVPDVFIDINNCDPTPATSRTYINTGVTLLNLRQWRTENATATLMEHLSRHASEMHYADQDALNAVFAGRVRYLPYTWNFQSDFVQLKPSELGMTPAGFRQLRDNPGIVHYAGRWKPWFYRTEVNYRDRYWKYLAMTPWRGFVPSDRTPKYIVMKAVRLKTLKRVLCWHFPALFRMLRRMQGKVGR